jgi:hypothetical protein
MAAFAYPERPHQRRHGPRGYAGYESYRPWLRDEFAFRCVFCLLREQGGRVRGTFDIDHFLPVVSHPDRERVYDNLLYCCVTCNAAKGRQLLPDPTQALLAGDVEVSENGTIAGRTPAAKRLIRVLGLDGAEYTEFRLLWQGIAALAESYDPELYRRLMGFPNDPPDLARLRPPGGNTRPEGVQASYFARMKRGEPPETC